MQSAKIKYNWYNYLFALGDLVYQLPSLEIPVYLADSVLWPKRMGRQMLLSIEGAVEVPTSIKTFFVPKIWVDNKGDMMRRAAPLVEELAHQGCMPSEAMERFKKEGLVFPPHEKVVLNFYEKILELEKEGKNGIWARFLKNAFAPMAAEKFEFVVGNPPWIRWDYLSQEYREATLEMWKSYGLFSLKGFQSRLGGGKKDFSMLFTYAAADHYLSRNGKLGFLITQEVFKSKGAGEGFRGFKWGAGQESNFIKVLKAHDFSSFQPFEGAANKTAAIILKKGEKTEYPLPYYVWIKKKGIGKIPTDKLLNEILPALQKKKLIARPLNADRPESAWQTFFEEFQFLSKIKGKNYYKAILGANPNPYGVFWLQIKQVLSDGNMIIRNLTEKGKLEIQKVEETIEIDLVYPAIRGRDIERWGTKQEVFMLVVQDPETRTGLTEKYLKSNFPRTYGYLLRFKHILLDRALYKKYHQESNAPFYSQFNISKETFSHYKVVWQAMSNDIYATITSQIKTSIGFKVAIPLHTTSFFATNSEPESHYLCAIINSMPIRDFIKSFSSAGRGFGTPSVMENVGIPKFDPKNKIHQKLADISKNCHQLKSENKDNEVAKLEKENDELVKKLFGC